MKFNYEENHFFKNGFAIDKSSELTAIFNNIQISYANAFANLNGFSKAKSIWI